MHAIAKAKLNLFLHVTGKQDDGYHLLQTLVAFTAFGDEISIEPAASLRLEVTGEFASQAGADEHNSVMRAATALRPYAADAKAGALIRVVKHIPVGAGLGGGSADAAATLLMLNQLWQCGRSEEQLRQIGLSLGADVPMCLAGVAALVEGVGERVRPIQPLPSLPVLLLHPRQALMTAEVFCHRTGGFTHTMPIAQVPRSKEALVAFLRQQRNDLKASAVMLLPVIGEMLRALMQQEGSVYSQMTGSGSACFALFEKEAIAKEALQAILQQHPDWWGCVTSL